MELYTSLVRLKQAMNNGEMPPMTPITGPALDLIDPAFTIGLGALTEHPVLGLRCPIRLCGKHFHSLTYHLNHGHRASGGARAVKKALSIPSTAKLISSSVRERMSSRAQLRWAESGGIPQARTPSRGAYKRQARSLSENKLSVGARNLHDRCNAQLTHKLIDLEHSLGRSPTKKEAIGALGGGIVAACERVFGSWANAKGQCGLQVYRGGADSNEKKMIRRGAVLDALRAWYDAHGSLPRICDAEGRTNRTPYIPCVKVIFREMGAESWPIAMERAASYLNIYGGRYGLPESVRPKREKVPA